MNCISAAETGFCTKRCTSDEQTPRPPSPAHHKTFRPLHKYKLFAIPLTLICRRVWSSNLSTQLRRTQGLSTESLTMPATVADPNRSLDSEQISPATIAHHTVYENIPNLHQSHMCQWGAQPYPGGSAISSRGQTSIFAMAVKEYFAFEKSCKWPKQRNFIDADIRPHFIVCL